MARRNMSFDEDVSRILDAVADGQSTASAYVSDLVRDADRRWRSAHLRLVQAGWLREELLAACDALNGWGMIEQPATWAAASMVDAQTYSAVCAKWGVDEVRWAELARTVHSDARTAEALVDLAAEFWRMNPLVERSISDYIRRLVLG